MPRSNRRSRPCLSTPLAQDRCRRPSAHGNAWRSRLYLLGALTLAPGSGLAASPATEGAYEGKPVRRIELVTLGGQWSYAEQLPAGSLGAPFSGEYARELTRHLLEQGRYAEARVEVAPAPDGVTLRLSLVPRRIIGAIETSGARAPARVDTQALGLRVGDEVTPASLDTAAQALRKECERRGFPRCQAQVRSLEMDPGRSVRLLVTVHAGPESRVSGRTIHVTPSAPPREIRETLASFPIGPGSAADREQIDAATAALNAALERAGYSSAAIDYVLTGDALSPQLAISVVLGQRLAIAFEGNHHFDRQELLEALPDELERNPSGQPLAQALRAFYVARGFYDVEVTPKATLGAEHDDLRLVLKVREGERVRVTERHFPCLSGPLSAADLTHEIDGTLAEALPGGGAVFSPPNATALNGAIAPQGLQSRRADALVLDPWTTLDPSAYQQALEHIERLYRADGYLSATVGPLTVRRQRCDPSRLDVCLPLAAMPTPPTPCDPGTAAPAAPTEPTCSLSAAERCGAEASVVIPVKLGPQALLWDLRFEGNERLADSKLATESGLQLGLPISQNKLENARKRLLERYAEDGHPYASVEAELVLSPDQSRARAHFVINEHQPVRVSQIRVQGARFTDPELVLERVALKPGALYRQSAVRASEERLASLGVFAGANVQLEDPEVPARQKAVVVQLSEQLPQYLDLRPGFSTGDGFRLAFEYGHQNLAERAIRLSLRIQLGYLPPPLILDPAVRSRFEAVLERESLSFLLERSNLLGLEFPDVGLGARTRLSVEGIDVRDIFRDFARDKRAAIVTLSYRPTRTLSAALSGSLELNLASLFEGEELRDYLQDNPNPGLSRLLLIPDGLTLAGAERLELTWDGRDAPLAATRGAFVSVAAEHVNAIPLESQSGALTERTFDSHFMHYTARLAGYLRLTERGMALASSVALGVNQQLRSGSQTYPDRFFFLGGVDSLRGFLFSTVIPEDVAQDIRAARPDGNGETLTAQSVPIRGGDLMVNPRLELRIPMLGMWHTAVFLDSGNLWLDSGRMTQELRLRYAAGAGLRISTPVGPLALDYGVNLARRSDLGEPFGAFNFSIGLF